MKTLTVAYFDKLGVQEIQAAKNNLVKNYPDLQVTLKSMSHDQAFDALKENEVDIAINDLRDEKNNLQKIKLTERGLIAVLQKGTYQAGLQMIEKDELRDLICFLICSPNEEAEELHLHKDLWQIHSPFIAVNNFDEAGVLISSGSGYFIMNEGTATLISNDMLQKLFLLNDGRQMKQSYYAFYQKNNALIDDFIKCLQTEYED